jgi:hypothetical protein
MELINARFVENDCSECLKTLLAESKSLGGLPLAGEIVIIPKNWLSRICPHGCAGLKFEPQVFDSSTVGIENPDVDRPKRFDSRMDATKNIGYPAREHGPYGSHPMHDDFR